MSDQMVKLKLDAATDRYLALGVDDGTTEDADNRFELRANGKMEWGNGTDAQDVVLERSSTGVLDLSTGSLALGGTTITATAAEINRAADASSRVVNLAVSTSITEAAHDGKIIVMGGAGSARTFTLPAATGSGAKFHFVVGAVNTSNYIIAVANASDTMDGSIISLADGGDTVVGWETASTSDTITLNGTTTGGVAIGDEIVLIDIATNQWAVRGQVTSSGTEATPFSAAV